MSEWEHKNCVECGKEDAPIYSVDADGNELKWCEECFPEDTHTYCNGCQVYRPVTKIVTIEHSKLQRTFVGCERCLPQFTWSCGGCGIDIPLVEEVDGQLVQVTACNCTVSCKKCGRDTLKRKVLPHKAGCIDCTELTDIREHTFKPNKFTINTCKSDKEFDRSGVLMGVELEYHLGGSIHRRALATAITDQVPSRGCYYFVHDGTVCRRRDSSDGIELVTHPFSLNALVDSPAGRRFWSALRIIRETIDIKAHDEFPNAGIHIHLSKSSMSRLHLFKLQSFMNSNPAFVSFISGRDFNHEYCRFVYSDKNRLAKMAKGEAPGQRRKYSALNLDPADTIEFRTFKSSVYEEDVWRCIEFVHALHRWSKTASLKDVYKYDVFVKFVYTNRKDYPNLFKSVKEF